MLNTTDTAQVNNKNTPTFQPMRFGEILDTTFNLYRKHFLLFLGVIVLYFCGILVEYLFGRFLPEFSGKNFVVDLIDMPFTLISMGGIIIATATIYLSGHITSGNALKQVRHLFWHVLVCSVVWSVAFDISRISVVFPIFSVINPITPWTPGSSVDTDPLIRLPYMLAFLRLVSMPFSIYLQTPLWHIFTFLLFSFIVKSGLLWIQWILLAFAPFSTYFAVRWTFATTVVLLEKPPIRRAFERSSVLTRGRWWRVWGVLISFSVLTFAVQRILEGTVGFILVLTRLVGATSPMDILRWMVMYTPLDADPLFYTIMMWTGFAVITLIFPIWVIGITLLYFDLRVRKEGFGIESAAATVNVA